MKRIFKLICDWLPIVLLLVLTVLVGIGYEYYKFVFLYHLLEK